MKQKIEKYFQLGFLLLGIAIFITSCQVEDDTNIQFIEKTPQQSRIKVEVLNINQIKTNDLVMKQLGQFKTKDKQNNTTSAYLLREIHNSDYGFTINTDVVNYTEDLDNNYHSYAFSLTRDTPNDTVENLVLSLNENGDYNAFIVTYGFTKEEYKTIDYNTLTSRQTHYTPIDFDTTVLNSPDVSSKIIVKYVCYEVWTAVEDVNPIIAPGFVSEVTWVVHTECGFVYGEDGALDDTFSGLDDGGGSNPNSSNNPSGGTSSSNNPPDDTNDLTLQDNITTTPVVPSLSFEFFEFFAQLNQDQKDFLDNLRGDALKLQIDQILQENDYDEPSQMDIINEISALMEAPNVNVNPILGADCRSFEFAQPPGALQKGCAVTDFNHTFYTAGVRPNGSPYIGYIVVNYSPVYFTMPNMITNGQAANLAAIAVTAAILLTDTYFFENPDISEFALANYFKNTINNQLALVGGSFSTTVEPFLIPSPAPYITSILGIGNPYDCD